MSNKTKAKKIRVSDADIVCLALRSVGINTDITATEMMIAIVEGFQKKGRKKFSLKCIANIKADWESKYANKEVEDLEEKPYTKGDYE